MLSTVVYSVFSGVLCDCYDKCLFNKYFCDKYLYEKYLCDKYFYDEYGISVKIGISLLNMVFLLNIHMLNMIFPC